MGIEMIGKSTKINSICVKTKVMISLQKDVSQDDRSDEHE